MMVVAVPVFYLIAAMFGGMFQGQTAYFDPASTGAPVDVGLVFGPIHVDFVLPATPQTRATFEFARMADVPINDPSVTHVIVGWGSEQFYTTAGTFADVTWSALWRGVIGDRSVLRIDVAANVPANLDIPRLRLSPMQYDALLTAIAETATDRPIPDAGFTNSDGFFSAHGRFHIFRTCNTWVSDMLRAAGVPMGAWTPTPYAVRASLWRMAL